MIESISWPSGTKEERLVSFAIFIEEQIDKIEHDYIDLNYRYEKNFMEMNEEERDKFRKLIRERMREYEHFQNVYGEIRFYVECVIGPDYLGE